MINGEMQAQQLKVKVPHHSKSPKQVQPQTSLPKVSGTQEIKLPPGFNHEMLKDKLDWNGARIQAKTWSHR